MNEVTRILFKLKFYKGKVTEEEFDVKNLPEDIVYNNTTGDFIRLENKDVTEADIDRFLEVKHAYNFNIIKNCVIAGTIFFVITACLISLFIIKIL